MPDSITEAPETESSSSANVAAPMREADIRSELEKQVKFYNALREKSVSLQVFFDLADAAGFELAFIRK